MPSRKLLPAVPLPPQVGVPLAAAEVAKGIGENVAQAATAPIVGTRVEFEWDAERGEWKPLKKERTTNLNAVSLLVGGALVIGAAAVGQRGLRTGTVGLQTEYEYRIVEVGKKDRRVWATSPQQVRVKANQTLDATGRTRRRPQLRQRDSIADYQQIGGV